MKKSLLLLSLYALLFYRYLAMQNEVTQARLEIPKLAEELKTIEETSAKLKFQIDAFENPDRLIELSRERAFSHLKYPYLAEIVRMPAQAPLSPDKENEVVAPHTHRPPLVVGAKP